MTNNQQQARRDFTNKVHHESYDFISPLKLDLAGRHVLITGAAHESGVGYATAMAFAKAGASAIAVVDLQVVDDALIDNLKKTAIEAGRPEPLVQGARVDISNQQSVKALYQQISDRFSGRLDVLVNNAAYMEPQVAFLDADPETDWKTWEVNIRGLFNMVREFLPMQLSSRTEHDGLCKMINLTSSGALSIKPGGASYRTSKLAILRWTENLQLDYADKGLLAFCVNPGAIKTQISSGILPDQMRDMFPHQSNIAGDTIAWLASERRDWLGGRYVSCPWDMEELLSRKDEIINGDKLKFAMKV